MKATIKACGDRIASLVIEYVDLSPSLARPHTEGLACHSHSGSHSLSHTGASWVPKGYSDTHQIHTLTILHGMGHYRKTPPQLSPSGSTLK